MADTLKRSQVLQQQIDNLQKAAPPPLTQAEREQIMRNRRKQDDIDAGRRAISEREDAIDKHTTKVNDLLGKLDNAIRDEGSEATRRERETNANPLLNTIVPAGIGAAGGAAIGEIGNRILHEFSKGNAEAIKGIAKELGPVENLTNSQINRSRAKGAGVAADKYAPSSVSGKFAGGLGRALSYGIPAGVFYNEYTKYNQRAEDPTATEADRLANGRIANGLLGVATGIGADGGMRFFFPSRHQGEGEAMARINAARDWAKRMDEQDARPRSGGTLADRLKPSELVPQSKISPGVIDAEVIETAPLKSLPAQQPAVEAPDKPAAAPGTKAYMAAQAKELGLKGTSKLTKGELATKLAEAMSEHGTKRTVAKRLPKLPGGSGAAALAGGLAYGLTPDAAEAADGTTRGGRGEALTNAGIAGGTAYGVSKLAEKLGPMASKALATGGAAMSPMAIVDASDAFNLTPEQLDADAHKASQVMPAWARKLYSAVGFPEVENAYQMQQLPERGDRSDEAMIARDRVAQQDTMPLPQAEALTIPEGIPAPNPDGSSPFPEDYRSEAPAAPFSPNVMGRLSRMQKLGASPEQIASFLNQAVR